MPLFTLPITPDLEAWSQSTELDGRVFRLDFDWSRREQAWYLDIFGSDGTPLAIGLKLCENVNVLRREVSTLLPPGPLVVLDTTGAHEEPTLEGLGGRWVVFYGSP